MDAVISKIADADKVIVRHLRVREILWLRLIVFAPLAPCLLPLLLLGLFGADAGDVINWVYRLIVPVHHDINIELLGRDGETFAACASRPRTASEGDDLVREVLLAARQARCTVHEVIGKGAAGVVGTWDGAHQLLHDEPDVARAEAVLLECEGVTVNHEANTVVVTASRKGLGRVGAGILLLLFGLVLWALAFTSNGRRFLRGLWWDLKGVEPAHWVVRAGPDGIHSFTQRRDMRWDESTIPATDLVAIGHMRRRLGYTAQVAQRPGCVVVVTTQATHALPAGSSDARAQFGPALAELLVAHLR